MTLEEALAAPLDGVTVTQSRWSVTIRGTRHDTGELVEVVASSDSAFTMGDGIWLGTLAEYQSGPPSW